MNLLKLSWKNIWHKPLSAGLSILLLALGVGLISFLGTIGSQLEKQFKSNLENVHMVVGAKGSPVQIILSAIYHISPPTGNISYHEAQQLSKNPMVDKAIPMSLGDSYMGMRIVGTNWDYVTLYNGEIDHGIAFKEAHEVVIGASAADRLNLKIGSEFIGNHGLQKTEDQHDEHPYKVVGILKPTGLVLDKLILCNLESVWAAHSHHDNAHTEEPEEITNLLLTFKSKLAHLTMPRMVNEQTEMQAAMPSIEVNMLLSNLGIGISTLWFIGLIVIIVSGLSVFVSLFNSIKERMFELALLRSLGASKWQLFALPIYEAIVLATIGGLLGIMAKMLGGILAQNIISEDYGYSLSLMSITIQDIYVLIIAIGIAILAAVIPAISAMRVNISHTLAND
ncbi:MAG: ABC transporter permease [Bacteroidetes bacterium]|nr:ABC transporter permease [Bacteroidota bacterium]